MIALVQRVSEAKVTVESEIVGSIGNGMLILLGVRMDDTQNDADWLAKKCANLRIFRDKDGAMNRSLIQTGGNALVVSQFTLYGDSSKGNRPSYIHAARPEHAEPLYNFFVEQLSALIRQDVETGTFGAMMDVQLVNDGPVTLIVERRTKHDI